jgi:hypothetical protein
MLRSIPRSFRPLTRASRSTRLPASLAQATRSYATETSLPPSKNDAFANGTNAFYADQ